MGFTTEIQKLIRSKGFQKYFKNTSWMLGGKVLQMGVTFFVTAYVARYLGPSDFGLLNYARSFGTFFLIFATLGLQTLLMRNLVEKPELAGKTLGTALMMRFASSLVSILVFFGVTQLFPEHDYLTNVLILLVVGSAFFQSFDSLESYFQAEVKSQYSVQVRFGAVMSFSAMQLVMIYLELPVIWFGWAFLLRNVIAGLGMLFVYQRHFGKMSDFSFDFSYAKKLFMDALPLIFSGVVVILYMKVDQVMIMNLMGDEAVGQYTAALRFSEIWYFGGGLLTAALFPAIVNAKKHSEKRYLKRLQHFYDLMVYVAIGIALPVALLGPWLLQQDFLFGDAYDAAGPVLQIHVWTLVFVFLGVAASKQLIAENLQRIELYRTIFGAVINMILNYFLIQSHGITGAAVATLISQAFASWLGYLLSRKTWTVFRLQSRSLLFISLYDRIRGKGSFDMD